MTVVAMFPGQGSQRPAMARALAREHPAPVDEVLRQADEVLGLPLRELCLDGSAADLTPTELTQPAVLTVSVAVLRVLRLRGFTPGVAVGHSLGEYSALVCAGVLSFEDALRLVRRRGELMAAAGNRTPGAMAALQGLPAADVEQLCRLVRDAGHGVVSVANYNTATQTVVSGADTAVSVLTDRVNTGGSGTAVRLPVSAAFHSVLMDGAEADFADEMDRVAFAEPRIPVVAASTGTRVRTAAEVRQALRRQLSGPVRWEAALRCAARGAEGDGSARNLDLVEIGPGRVLTGLARRILPHARAASTDDARRLRSVLERPRARTREEAS